MEALDGRRAVLLGGHGVVALGASPAAALVTCQSVERQAQIAWLLRRSGRRDRLHTSSRARRESLQVCSSAFQTEPRS